MLEDLRSGMRILDLGCGTGNLMLEAAKRLNGQGEAVGLDFSENMLALARQRADDLDLDAIRFECRSAENIPFEAEPYDIVVSAFVLRNIGEKLDDILRGVNASLKSGGSLRFMDFTEPSNAFIRACWVLYMNTVVAFYAWALFGKDFPMSYMTESARLFFKPPEFVAKLEQAGFKDVRVEKFMMGIIVLYKAEKS